MIGEDCTANTDCASGSCKAGQNVCQECTTSSDCDNANFCDTTVNPKICKIKLQQSDPCTLGNTQCDTDHCVDGFCCDTDCTGTCKSCDGAHNTSGNDGTCGNVVVADDPDNECPTTGNGFKTGSCDGNGACGFKAAGSNCGSAATCVNGTTSNPQDTCAGGADTCNAGSNMSCLTNYACTGGVCATTCTMTSQCSTGHCELDAASSQKNDCVACTGTGQCGGNHCEESTASALEDTCVQCRQAPANTDCSAGLVCRPADDTCVECFQASNCTTNADGSACLASANCGCSSDANCMGASATGPHCALSGANINTCRDCDTDPQCTTDVGHNCSPGLAALLNKCGCAADTDCNMAGTKPHCALSGANNQSCQECDTDPQCTTDVGHNCTPTAGLTNKCGCAGDGDFNAAGTKPHCALGAGTPAANLNTCQLCNIGGNDCSGAPGKKCLDGTSGTTANTCGCTTDSPDCGGVGSGTCNVATHVCNP